MTAILIGRKGTTSKNTGKKYFSYYFMTEFNNYELENADCLGHSIIIENTSLDFNAVSIGDECELVYGKGFQDKAVLTGIKVVKPSMKK